MRSSGGAAIVAFFESYRSAFEHGDAQAIAGHFAFPCHVTSAGDPVSLAAVTTRDDWISTVERLLSMYRTIGVASAEVTRLAATELAPRLAHALVSWTLRDGAGNRLYAFEAVYTLARGGGGWRISAVAHNEIPRYREALARLKGAPAKPQT